MARGEDREARTAAEEGANVSDAYETATYYDCADSETLSHEDPGEAIEEYLDNAMDPDCDVSAFISEHGPITMTAYVRQSVPDSWVQNVARSLAEGAAERYSEEYGNPAGAPGEDIPYEAVTRAEAAIAATLWEMYAAGTVWACDRVAERVYEPAEVEQLMREYRPEWWPELRPKKEGA